MKFKDLKVGDCFTMPDESDDSYFMKLHPTNREVCFGRKFCNATCIQGSYKGTIGRVPDMDEVTKIVFTGIHALGE